MDEFEGQEIIEAYWCDKMSPEERAAFEQQLQSDPALLQQVEDWRLVFLATERLAQKDLQMNFARWKGEMDEPVVIQQKTVLKPTLVIGLLIFLIVLVMIGWGTILFFKPTTPETNRSTAELIETETLEGRDANAILDTPLTVISKESVEDSFSNKNAGKELTKSPNKAKKEYFAIADPANFSENKAMEMMIGGLRGSGDISLSITSPQKKSTFKPGNNGQTQLRFSGKVEEAEINTTVLLDLLIFNNQDINKQMLTLPLNLTTNAKGNANFDIMEKVNLQQGLYYFHIQERGQGELLEAGKFFIGSYK